VIGLYRFLLRLYPANFQSAFAAEMMAALARLRADKAHCGTMRRTVFSLREVVGLLAGIFVQRFRLRASLKRVPVVDSVSAISTKGIAHDDIGEAEESIRFHSGKTIDCIAHHRFEGARIHARAEELAQERLQALQQRSSEK
jgi:hypothetical protein